MPWSAPKPCRRIISQPPPRIQGKQQRVQPWHTVPCHQADRACFPPWRLRSTKGRGEERSWPTDRHLVSDRWQAATWLLACLTGYKVTQQYTACWDIHIFSNTNKGIFPKFNSKSLNEVPVQCHSTQCTIQIMRDNSVSLSFILCIISQQNMNARQRNSSWLEV